MSAKASPVVKVIFVIMSTICCGFLAMKASPLFIPKGAGLAGGVMVLMYGIIGLIIGLILSLIFKNKLNASVLKIVTGVLSLIGIAGLIWLFMKIKESQKKTAEQVAKTEEFYRTHKPKKQTAPLQQGTNDGKTENAEFGLGMAAPNFSELKTLHFYGNPTMTDNVVANDSVTFSTSTNGPEIATAPPYLVPQHLKMDYQIFYFLVKSQTRDHYEVVVNKKNGQTTWVSKVEVKFKSWPDFLLNVFAVEPMNWNDNLVRIKPMSHASPIQTVTEENILSPIQIKDDWIQVDIMDKNHKSIGKGWLKWRSESALLIDYSLLS